MKGTWDPKKRRYIKTLTFFQDEGKAPVETTRPNRSERRYRLRFVSRALRKDHVFTMPFGFLTARTVGTGRDR